MVPREQPDRLRRTGLLAALLVISSGSPHAAAAAEPPAADCEQTCLAHLMSQHLTQMVTHAPHGAAVAADAIIRENAAQSGVGPSIWKQARKILARQDFIDTASGNVSTWIGLQLDDARSVQLSERIKVHNRIIVEIETVVGGTVDAQTVPPVVDASAHRSDRQQLLGIANGYFEALGMRDLQAARVAGDCVDTSGGHSMPCLAGLDRGSGQQAIERRFPVALPEQGIVIGYALLMHHERAPPQDEFINVCLRVRDGRIVAVNSINATLMAPGRSGFSADFPAPAILRAAPALALAPPPAEPPVKHYPGYWRVHALLERLFPSPPQAQLPGRPYPGIADTRDIAYGADARQRLDILAPTPIGTAGRTVLVFVHGGAWVGGDKDFPNDILYENVVYWAARQGMVAVNLNYRLADYAAERNLYPTQEQDVAAAMDWLGVNISQYGGDPRRIFMWGHSAGGSTIASYASNPLIYGTEPGIKGIFLLSSPLDPSADERAGQPIRYFGATHQQYLQNAPLRTLLNSNVPVLIGYSPQEKDLAPEMQQAVRALCDHGHCPVTVLTHGTHDGEVRAVGSADQSATDALLAFMAKNP